MIQFTRALFLVAPLFLLTSCFTIHSSIVVEWDGKIAIESMVDMSQMVTLLSTFSSWSTTDTWSLNSKLCDDKNFASGLSEWKAANEIITCTNMGDYRAKIETKTSASDTPGILMLSGIVIIDVLHVDSDSKSATEDASLDDFDASPEELGFSITQSLTLPGKIVHKDAGTLSGTSTVNINLLDPKVSKKRELFIIATTDGKKLKPAQIARYKVLLRKQIRSAKKK